ncbi:ABC transporter permease [Helicobacter baculiformis]|uniref:ABC transporter permease n=1 Tax=Helicobacter baculiformis TaxID=427351 RepID=A0ABV7ZG84_9HELI|nr:ABC transporter permease [Helicobacter baculiformis]
MWQTLKRDKFTWILCLGAPLLLWALMVGVFYKELPTKLPIGIVDLDHSHLSQEIVSALNASSHLDLKHFYPSLSDAKADLGRKRIYGAVVLQKDLERHIKLRIKTPVVLYYNAEFVLVGKAILSAFTQVLMTLNIKNDVATNLGAQGDLNTAKALAFPLHANIHPLYNETNNYAQFLLGVILPCMWQILAALGMLNLLGHSQSLRQAFSTLWLNTFIFSLWGALMLWFLKPYYAHLGILLCGVVLMVLGISSVVLALYALLDDPIKSASAIAAYTAPSLAFVGVTYPVSNMDVLGEFWGSLLPVSYFIKALIALSYYSNGLALAWQSLAKMGFFILFLPLGLCIWRLKEKVA